MVENKSENSQYSQNNPRYKVIKMIHIIIVKIITIIVLCFDTLQIKKTHDSKSNFSMNLK